MEVLLMEVVKKFKLVAVAIWIAGLLSAGAGWAEEKIDKEPVTPPDVEMKVSEDETDKETMTLPDIQVTAPRTKNVPETMPEKTVIDLKDYKKPAPVHNVVDILKDSALVDFRGKSEIDIRSERGDSPILLRGFDVRRFVNAVDGVTFDQPLSFGQVVDYSLVPLDQIEEVEIIPGAHSARYSGKSMGGVINFKTKKPEKKESAKPDVKAEFSYGSYETLDNRTILEGGYKGLNYAASIHKYSTDGYLRHGASETDNYGCMLGYAFSSGGYLKYMGTFVEKDRESYASNDPAGNYDPNFPVVTADTTGAGNIEEDSKYHLETYVHRLSFMQPSELGKFSLGISYTDKTKHYSTEIEDEERIQNPNSLSKNLAIVLQDEVELFKGNTFVIGFDSLDFWTTSETREDINNHVRNHKSAFIEDTWHITKRLSVRAGLRYEDVTLNINNYSPIRGWGSVAGYQVTLNPPQKHIKKDWSDLLPKFFATYELDDHASFLRDTSVSMGVSRFWNVAPFCLG